MKRRFLLADTPEKRRLLAIVAANTEWAKINKGFPTEEFYQQFLEPFFQYEDRMIQLDEVHLMHDSVTKKRERELIDAIAFWQKKCVAKLNGNAK